MTLRRYVSAPNRVTNRNNRINLNNANAIDSQRRRAAAAPERVSLGVFQRLRETNQAGHWGRLLGRANSLIALIFLLGRSNRGSINRESSGLSFASIRVFLFSQSLQKSERHYFRQVLLLISHQKLLEARYNLTIPLLPTVWRLGCQRWGLDLT